LIGQTTVTIKSRQTGHGLGGFLYQTRNDGIRRSDIAWVPPVGSYPEHWHRVDQQAQAATELIVDDPQARVPPGQPEVVGALLELETRDPLHQRSQVGAFTPPRNATGSSQPQSKQAPVQLVTPIR